MIITSSKRQAHPIAAKIPLDLWRTVFDSRFDEDDLKIAGKGIIDVQRSDLPRDKDQALILLIICYPDAFQTEYLADLNLEPKHEIMFTLGAEIGRLDILKWLKKPSAC